MTKRVIVAGVLGGIAMFLWTSLAHVVLPLGSVGVSSVSKSEDALLNAMRTSLGDQHGLYLFPSVGEPADAAQMQRYAEKIANGPSGLLVFHPSGAQALAASQLVVEFLAELLYAFLAVALLSHTTLDGFGARVGFIALIGLLASLPTNISYWNWYGFPTNYTAAYVSVQIVGFCMAGVVAALVLNRQVRVVVAVPA